MPPLPPGLGDSLSSVPLGVRGLQNFIRTWLRDRGFKRHFNDSVTISEECLAR